LEDLLWNAIRKNDENAFTEMYKSYYQFLFVNGFRACADKELTKDCIHESLLEIWNKRTTLPEVQHVGAYLKSIVQRKILKEMPKGVRRFDVNLDGNETELIENSYEDLLILLQSKEEVKAKIKLAFQHLSPKQSEIIKMKFFDDKSYTEIAAVTDTSPRTIYNQVYESLKILRKYLVLLAAFIYLLRTGG